MTNKLFVAGLSYSLTDADLEKHFSTVGKVLSAKIIMDRNSGQSRGFGFVEMSTEDEAKKAITELNNTMLDGRTILVKESKPQLDLNNRSDKRSNRW